MYLRMEISLAMYFCIISCSCPSNTHCLIATHVPWIRDVVKEVQLRGSLAREDGLEEPRMKAKRGLTYEILALVYVAVLAAPNLLSELEIVKVDEELLVRGESIVFHLPVHGQPVFLVATNLGSCRPAPELGAVSWKRELLLPYLSGLSCSPASPASQ
jgi:hypothetical protein